MTVKLVEVEADARKPRKPTRQWKGSETESSFAVEKHNFMGDVLWGRSENYHV